MTKQVFVVPHTHWDREWFFTSDKAKVYLLKDLKDVIDHLEQNQEYGTFLLDGQTSLIEDYLSWRPQDTARVKKLVKDQKLFLGPWYTQTDQFMVSGESIINNLRIGMHQSSQLGGFMNIAYVPDSFGQESSLPQIYRSFGINDAVLYRGFSMTDTKKSEFIWQGEDGSQINVFRMACGYFIGGVIDETKLTSLMNEEPFKTVVEQATTDNILFPNGSDMAPLRFDLPEFIKKLNKANQGKFQFKVSSLPQYIAEVKKDKPQLNVIKGEQDCGRDMRVHKSIYSSRGDIKKLNTQLQNYLSNIMQPVLALGCHFNLEYPQKIVEDIWQKMGQNAAHDSMGSCVSDQVNENIKERYRQVKDIATSLVDVTLRQIATKVKNQGHPLTMTVFNTLPFVRKEVVNKTLYLPSRNFKIVDYNGKNILYEIVSVEDVTDLIQGATIQLDPGLKIYHPQKVYRINLNIELENIPALGYKQFYLLPFSDQKVELNKIETGTQIENKFFKIAVNKDGSLNILDKLNGQLYKNQAVLEENGDDGDSYNYSPPKKDLIIYSTNQKHHTQVVHSQLTEKLIINFDFLVPSNLSNRAKGILDTKMPVKLTVSLRKTDKFIDFQIEVDNRVPQSHRLCIDFASQIAAKSSIADIQFGTINRPISKSKELADWNKNQGEWQEKPISINTMQSFVALTNSSRCIAVIPEAVREYECLNKNNSIIRLTIFRTYGMLGKRDLLYRPGRPSGDETVPTPNAQLNQKLNFTFALTTEQANYDETNLANEVKEHETPLQLYQYAEFLNGRLTFPLNPATRTYDETFSLFTTTNNLTVSTVEKSTLRKGFTVRLYNTKFHDQGEQIIFNKPPRLVQLVDLKGDVIRNLELKNNKVNLPKIKHSKFSTIYFEF